MYWPHLAPGNACFAVVQLITYSSLVTTLDNLGGGSGPLKIAYCLFVAVRCTVQRCIEKSAKSEKPVLHQELEKW
jgi:hypothetical protein